MMKKQIKAAVMVLAVSFLTSTVALASDGANVKVRVTASVANVRLKPALDSSVIGSAKMGQVFDVIQKTGDWYQINLPPDAQGIVLSGYINKIVVEELPGEAAVTKKEEVKPEPKAVTPQKPRPTAPVVRPQPRTAPMKEPAFKKIYVRVGGGYALKTDYYENITNFNYYYEDGATIEEYYDINAKGVAIDAGVGFFFTKNIALEASVAPASGKTTGSFYAAVPHPFYFNTFRETEWTNASLKYSALELSLNAIFSVPVMRGLSVYLGGGGTYFMGVQIKSLKTANWSNGAYPYLEIAVNPEYANYKANCFGFNGVGGADYYLTNNIGVNLNVRYSLGSAKVNLEEGAQATLKPGGLKATLGIKYAF